jgi:hypothetical protein
MCTGYKHTSHGKVLRTVTDNTDHLCYIPHKLLILCVNFSSLAFDLTLVNFLELGGPYIDCYGFILEGELKFFFPFAQLIFLGIWDL